MQRPAVLARLQRPHTCPQLREADAQQLRSLRRRARLPERPHHRDALGRRQLLRCRHRVVVLQAATDSFSIANRPSAQHSAVCVHVCVCARGSQPRRIHKRSHRLSPRGPETLRPGLPTETGTRTHASPGCAFAARCGARLGLAARAARNRVG
eukprot:356001-Chlamydomonas_euryale.AAC.4